VLDWPAGPRRPTLAADDVHVWRADLDEAWAAATWRSVLSEDERLRADRFRFEPDRRRFTAGRGVLRALLGRYLEADPAALEFAYGPAGRPALGGPWAGTELSFSVAHSQALALYALTRGRAIGIDVEQVRSDVDLTGVAATAFSADERAALSAAAPAERRQVFFATWTSKEAYVKATGDGLGGTATDLQAPLAPEEARHWTFTPLDPGPGYAAALAVRGRNLRLSWFHWSPSPGGAL
jgi:4'-phosphopantetheinyl transferase